MKLKVIDKKIKDTQVALSKKTKTIYASKLEEHLSKRKF
jgi:hypothetical protein